MNSPLNACLHPSCQMFFPTRCLHILARYTQDEIRYEAAPGLSHSNRMYPWLIVQKNHPPSH